LLVGKARLIFKAAIRGASISIELVLVVAFFVPLIEDAITTDVDCTLSILAISGADNTLCFAISTFFRCGVAIVALLYTYPHVAIATLSGVARIQTGIGIVFISIVAGLVRVIPNAITAKRRCSHLFAAIT
tara:strand:+ start:250 stop:642 length:393 start_codon:yes stop_codon:yes gene_type:complete